MLLTKRSVLNFQRQTNTKIVLYQIDGARKGSDTPDQIPTLTKWKVGIKHYTNGSVQSPQTCGTRLIRN